MDDNFNFEYKKYLDIINSALEASIEIKYPEEIYKSMKYSLLLGGKRLRPVIALDVAAMFNIDIAIILPVALAIEMLHCQSLIHDDLPCMDNDDFRRGKPSNHKVFGEATAVLAGDAFLSYAPKFIMDKISKTVSPDIVLRLLREFFMAAGVDGIISGQIVDLDSEKKNIDEKTLNYIDEYKTAKLFKLAVRSAAILGNADENILAALTKWAEIFGHAFQICDDILDEVSTFEELGKTPGKDVKVAKSTYVSLFGLEEAKIRLHFLINQACDILITENINSILLSGITKQLGERADKCY